MLQDAERGVKTEVDEIYGAIVAAAKQAGLAVRLTESILQQVHLLESGAVKPGINELPLILKAKPDDGTTN